MKIQLNKLQEEMGSEALSATLNLPDGPGEGGTLGPGVDRRGVDLRASGLSGDDLSGARFYELIAEGATLSGVDLSEAEISHGRLARVRLHDCDLSDAHLSVVDAEELKMQGGSLQGCMLTGLQLGRARFEDVDLSGARLSLCDCFGCDFKGVNGRGATFRGSDLSYSSFTDVELDGADFRGCRLAYCTFSGVTLEGARFDGADLRGCRGLSDAQRAELRAQGVRLTAGWLESTVVAALKKAAPSLAAERAERASRAIGMALQGLLILGALALTLALFRDRVVPPEPSSGGEGDAAMLVREPTDKEVAQTRENLKTLQAAIQAAYETSERYGVAQYPRIDDLADNLFDRDGAGPGTERLPLVEGGLPANLLTVGEAVLPYCNDVAAQETLSGDDSDWHYCEKTGRIYACGGFTDAPTLEW